MKDLEKQYGTLANQVQAKVEKLGQRMKDTMINHVTNGGTVMNDRTLYF